MKIKKLKKGQMIVSSLCESDDIDNTATLIWGRMNPITRGHLAMIEFAKQQEGDTFVYLSHSQDAKKNPLPYGRKIYWTQLAAGDVVKESNAKIIIQALQEIEALGYNKLIYICGSDRKEEMETLLNKYNGTPDKKGNIPYTFRSIEIKQFGDERLNEDVPLEKCSASLARKCVEENDFETFRQVVPFGDEDAEELFNELKQYMGLNEALINEKKLDNKINLKLNNYDCELRDESKNGKKGIIKMGRRHYYRDMISLFNKYLDVVYEGKSYKIDEFEVVQKTNSNHGLLKFMLDGSLIVLEGTQGSERGADGEVSFVEDDSIVNKTVEYIDNYLSSIYGNLKVAALVGKPKQVGGEKNKRNQTWSSLFNTSNLKDRSITEDGMKIADVIYNMHIETSSGKSHDLSIPVSVKEGKLEPTPVNMGLAKVEISEIISKIYSKLTLKEKELLETFWKTNNGPGSKFKRLGVKSDSGIIKSWKHTIQRDSIDINNIRNLIINSYGSGYIYAHKIGNNLDECEHITDKLNKFGSINNINSVITQSSIYINVAIEYNDSLKYFKVALRRKGGSNMTLQLNETSRFTEVSGEEINIKSAKFEPFDIEN